MKFTVSRLSKMTGLSMDTLRHYRDTGLLCGKKDDQNGYYYYDLDDAVKSLFIRRNRCFDAPIASLPQILGEPVINGQLRYLRQREQKLKDSIAEMEFQLKHLRAAIHYCELSVEKLNCVEEIYWDDVLTLYILGERLTHLSDDKHAAETIRYWVSQMPLAYLSLKIPLDELSDDSYDAPYHTEVGLAAVTQTMEHCTFQSDPPAEIVPAGKSLRTFIAVPDLFGITPKDIAPLRDYAKTNGYRFVHSTCGWVTMCSYGDGETLYYVLIRARVEKTGS